MGLPVKRKMEWNSISSAFFSSTAGVMVYDGKSEVPGSLHQQG